MNRIFILIPAILIMILNSIDIYASKKVPDRTYLSLSFRQTGLSLYNSGNTYDLEHSFMINSQTGAVLILLGSFTFGAGMTFLGAAVGLFLYGDHLYGLYWDDNLNFEENYQKPILNIASEYTSAGMYLFISGGIIAGLGLIGEIIAIPFLAKAGMLKKIIRNNENKLSVAPYISINKNIICGLTIML
jgi:hypothetical protein